MNAYLELTKPRLSALVLATTAAGFWVGLRDPSRWLLLGPAILGTALCAGGANALNQWLERSPDACMARTRGRPLPSGRLQPPAARRFGLLLIALGTFLLSVTVGRLPAMLAALTVATYLLAYTPMKRRTALCTLVGAIPGALPPMIGWAAARGELGPGAWILFTVLFMWQLPHFLALAWLYRDDYARASFRMLPLTAPPGASSRQILLYGLALWPVSLLPGVTGLVRPEYVYGAAALGALFVVAAAAAAARRSPAACRRLFLASIVYLPLLLGWLAWNKPAL